GQQIDVGREFADMEVAALPTRFVDRIFQTRLQHVEHEAATVTLPGRTDFPEFVHGHAHVVGAGSAEARVMEDRLAPAQLVQHVLQMEWRREIGFLAHALATFAVCCARAHATCSRTSGDGSSARAASASITSDVCGALPSATATLRMKPA